uniref:MFS domain-containing protein n=1 Tax=Strongyloides stercoralis TaxID=6248 RepID=A0AAF5DCM1_STRER
MDTETKGENLTAAQRRELRRQKILGNTEGRVNKLFGVAGVRPEAAPALDGITQSQLKETINNHVEVEKKTTINSEDKLADEYKDKELEESLKKIDNFNFNKLVEPKTFSMRANISLIILVIIFSLTQIPFLPSIFSIVIANVMVEVRKTAPNVDKLHIMFLSIESMKRLILKEVTMEITWERLTHCLKDKAKRSLLILLTINLLNYMDRYTISGVLSQLKKYYTIDDTSLGLLQTAFIIFYMLCAPVCGYLGDRYNRKIIMSVGLIIWMCSVLASSFCTNSQFVLFLLCRGLVGVGEASYATIAPTIIADLFTGPARSYALMIFYFAIPFGSGLGYISGSYISLATGHWQWGIRTTPILGILCLIIVYFYMEDPERGSSEHVHLRNSTYMEDIKYLLSIKTYIFNTLGLTCVIFCVGALSFWAPTFIEYAYIMDSPFHSITDPVKASISLIFGMITCGAGIVGVVFGSTIAEIWRDGRYGISPLPYADPIICAIGSLVSVPFLFFTLIFLQYNIPVAWVLCFIGITSMCMNWSVNADMVLYTVTSNRHATATAFQTLVSHALGDAISPYIVGVISDMISGDSSNPGLKFHSLQYAFFLPNLFCVFSGAFYLLSTFTVERDKQNVVILSNYEDLAHLNEMEDDNDDLVVTVREELPSTPITR